MRKAQDLSRDADVEIIVTCFVQTVE